METPDGPASLGLRVIVCIKFDSRAPADEVARLKRRLIDDDRALHSIDVSGSFDFITEVSLPNMSDYQDWVEEFADAFASLVEHHEANFICRRYVREQPGPIHYLWVTGNGGSSRIDCDEIERFSAEGDYVRAHSASRSWLVNSSLAKLVEQLDPNEFIRIHRSTVARRDAIIRLRHQRHAWYAVVRSGEVLRIAKSHVSEVVRSLRDDWPATHAVSATGERLSENPAELAEQ
jgi:hypothetical protein